MADQKALVQPKKEIRYRKYTCIEITGIIAFFFITGGFVFYSISIVAAAVSVKKAYNVDQTMVGYLSSIGSLSALIIFFPINFIVIKFGIRLSLLLSLFIAAIGMSTQFLIDRHFGFAILGQFILNFGINGISSCQAKFIAVWIPEKHRALCFTLTMIMKTSVATVHNIFFQMVLYRPGDDADSGASPEDLRDRFRFFFMLQLSVIGASFLLVLFLIFNKPRIPLELPELPDQEEDVNQNLNLENKTNNDLLTDQNETIQKENQQEEEEEAKEQEVELRRTRKSTIGELTKRITEIQLPQDEESKTPIGQQIKTLLSDKLYIMLLLGPAFGKSTAVAFAAANTAIYVAIGVTEKALLQLNPFLKVLGTVGIIFYQLVIAKRKGVINYAQIITFVYVSGFFVSWSMAGIDLAFFYGGRSTFGTLLDPMTPISLTMNLKFVKDQYPNCLVMGTSLATILALMTSAIFQFIYSYIMNYNEIVRAFICCDILMFCNMIAFFMFFTAQLMAEKRGIKLDSNQ